MFKNYFRCVFYAALVSIRDLLQKHVKKKNVIIPNFWPVVS